MKRTICIFLTVILTLLTALCCGAALADGASWSGAGTESDPWRITSAADLVKLREYTLAAENNTLGKYFVLTQDISLAGYCGTMWGDWIPIGCTDGNENLSDINKEEDVTEDPHVFKGSFDGGGHTISGLYIANGGDFSGLFGAAGKEAVLKNLTVMGMVSGKTAVGGLAGYSAGRIENCVFGGTVHGSAIRTGGLVGNSTGVVANCTVGAEVSGENNCVGGVVGVSKSGGTIENCTFSGKASVTTERVGGIAGENGYYSAITGCSVADAVIEGPMTVGGIVGVSFGQISDCDFSGTLFATQIEVGGITGYADLEGFIKNCRAEGSVSGGGAMGGIAGQVYCEISDCTNYASIDGVSTVGGIVGMSSKAVKNCENHGKVEASDGYAGGISGYMVRGSLENCINYANVSGHADIGGIVAQVDKGNIIACTNYGSISADYGVGGIVAYGLNVGLIDCVNKGSVWGGSKTGWIMGYSSRGMVLHCSPNGGSGEVTVAVLGSESRFAPACDFTRADYDFYTWSTEPDGGGTWYAPGDELPDVEQLTLYAVWRSNLEQAYVDENGAWQTAQGIEKLQSDRSYLSSGWYTLSGTVTLKERLEVNGDVHLILAEGAMLNAEKGIRLTSGNSLTVYGCGAASGTLNATGATGCAGIGGEDSDGLREGGTLTVNGGTVVALGGAYGAGIGGGDEGQGGIVTVNGGSVTAKGKEGGAGIGGGDYARGGTFTINGGMVTAIGSKRVTTGQASPGIGSGRPRKDGSDPLYGGTMNFNGGTVTARAGGTDEGIGAYAIGVNYQDFTSTPGQYGNYGAALTISIAQGMAVTPASASVPVLFKERAGACMNGEVTIAPCRQHYPALAECHYCKRRVTFGEFLIDTTTGYMIQSSEDWDNLALLINECGVPCEGEKFRLTADIAVSTMIGTSDCPFRGSFDGAGYTLTLNIAGDSSERYVAPFQWIEGAAIRNVRTAGTVSGGRHSAGLVGSATGTNTIENCTVAASVTAGDKYVGGILGHGHSSNTAIRRCVFSGSLSGTANGGTIWGWSEGDATAVIENCLDVSDSAYPMVLSYKTLAPESSVENIYYFSDGKNNASSYAVVPGKLARAVSADGSIRFSVASGSSVGYTYNSVLYAGEGDVLPLVLNSEAPDGSALMGYTVSAGTLTQSGDQLTLTLADSDAQISALLLPGEGTQGDPIRIGSGEAWDTLATALKNGFGVTGQYFELTDDLSVSTPLGTQSTPFDGAFDGCGKTLTVNLVTKDGEDACIAPFRWIRDAAIRNLKTAGTVTGGEHSAGLVGAAAGSNYIKNCAVSVDMLDCGQFAGGILGHGQSSETRISGCVFSGSIQGSRLRQAATIWGWSGEDAQTKIEDCLDLSDSPYPLAMSEGPLAPGSRAVNTYYTFRDKNNDSPFAVLPGARARGVFADRDVTIDFGRGEEYGCSGITAYPVGLAYGGEFYAGEGETVEIGLSCAEPPEGYTALYSADAGALAPGANGWTLTLAGENTVISVIMAPPFGAPDFILPTGLTQIDAEAFEGAAMTAVDIPALCAGISDYAFRDCPALTQIRIPAACVLGTDVFEGCRRVYVYGTAGSPAEAYCAAPEHRNCVFVPETN